MELVKTQPPTKLDQKLCGVVAWAKKVEKDMLEIADSKSEYDHLISEKIQNIQRELVERKEQRR